jgi:hypothetical protein
LIPGGVALWIVTRDPLRGLDADLPSPSIGLPDEADLAAEVERKKALVADLGSNHDDQARQREATLQPLRAPAPALAGAPSPISPVAASTTTAQTASAVPPPTTTTTAHAPQTLSVEEREAQQTRANVLSAGVPSSTTAAAQPSAVVAPGAPVSQAQY